MALCRFFAKGFCSNGDSCKFIHEPSTSTGQHLAPIAPVFSTTEKLNAPSCHFFLQGKCNKGNECRYSHLLATIFTQQVPPDALFVDASQLPPDSRKTVHCRFLSSPSGCQNSSCPYLHVADEPNIEKTGGQYLEANEEEASIHLSDFVEARINLICRTKSAKTTSFEIFQELRPTSTKWDTFSKSPSRQTSHLYASQALCKELLRKEL